MADRRNNDWSFNPFAPAEPRRDEALGALLRQALGDVPDGAVDWEALAARITRALPSRASTAWWSYADRWSRRMLPIALAASLAGAFALWRAEEPAAQIVAQVGAADVVAEMVQGAPIEDAARTFARSVTSEVNLAELAPQ
ncbi:MAG TPA: hypothetical protein VL328_09740 [Gemmatimonadaceae bacterium]|jgi:hypothetical protein|nr:hypothetical protein [Gemmatimonadaceae bacterium]